MRPPVRACPRRLSGACIPVGGGLAEAATGPTGPASASVSAGGLTRRRKGTRRGLGASCWQFTAKAQCSQPGASAPRPRLAPLREASGHAGRLPPDLVSLSQGSAGWNCSDGSDFRESARRTGARKPRSPPMAGRTISSSWAWPRSVQERQPRGMTFCAFPPADTFPALTQRVNAMG